MSRWIKLFDTHAFKTTWEDLKEKLELVEIDKTLASDVEELARLKKIVTFIDNAIDGIDFELIPNLSTTVLNNWNTKATDCKNQINSFNSNNNITYLKNANKSIDELLNYLKSYIFTSDKLKKSLLASIRAYTNEVDKHLEQITDTQTEYEKAKKFRDKIEEYYDLLFEDSDEEESIKLQISTLLEKAEEQYREINKFYNETLIDEEQESTKTTVEEAKKNILRDAEEANKKLVDVSAKIDELDKFYINIFGSENEDGLRSGGLKKEIEQRVIALNKFKTVQEENYTKELDKRLKEIKIYEDKQQKNIKNYMIK